MAYEAIVAKLQNVRKFEGADRILLANCLGYQVIVGLDSKDDDVVILFPDDGQLSEEYAKANDLIGYTDETGKRKGGFFAENRRVKAQKFRGEKSEAYVASLDSVRFTGIDINTLTVGTRFTELNGVPICNKYYTPATLRAAKLGGKTQAGYNKERLKQLFPEHKDTDQFRFAQPKDLFGIVTLTHKLHGTSARTGNIKIPVKQKYTFWQKVRAAICHEALPEEKMEQKIVYGTRRVVKGDVEVGPEDYRVTCAKILAPYIQKGEIWYYEIVGFEDTGRPIMEPVSTSEMPKDFRKRFGDVITYKYGCLPNTCDIYVYRITTRNEDGFEYELPWNVVKDRCNRAGIKHVPEIWQYMIHGEFDYFKLEDSISYYTESVDIAEPIDESHIREGICIRVDKFDGTTKIYKNKTFAFKVLEGIAKSDEAIDAEELEALGE